MPHGLLVDDESKVRYDSCSPLGVVPVVVSVDVLSFLDECRRVPFFCLFVTDSYIEPCG